MTFVQLKTGDVVKLVSGGPSMVVNKIMGDRIECRWFVSSRGPSTCT